MLQSLLRTWLMGTAQQKMREAAAQAAQSATHEPGMAEEQGPPESDTPGVCHVGLVFALGIESGGLIDRLSGVILTEGSGFVAREGGLHGRRLVIVEAGVGSENAARATQALILGHQPRWVISAGFAGGLVDNLAQGDILMADQIVGTDGQRLDIDFKFAEDAFAAPRRLHVGRLLTTDHVIAEPKEKRELGRRYGAMGVDMESLAVAEACRKEKIRFLSIRVISDAVDRALPPDIDYLIKKKSTAGRLGAAAGAILRRPASIKDMWQLKEDGIVASERLAKFVAGIVGQLR
jgi:adenosylhomocysteine nucleosidase